MDMGKRGDKAFFDNVSLVHSTLMTKYPTTFFSFSRKEQTKPLKLGIDLDIHKQNPELWLRSISYYLHHYTNKNRYLLVVANGGDRIDLSGNKSGDVSEKHQQRAGGILLQREPKKEPNPSIADVNLKEHVRSQLARRAVFT
jgi:sRNA-binding protein